MSAEEVIIKEAPAKNDDTEIIVKKDAPAPKADPAKIPEKIVNAYREFLADGKEFIWGNVVDGSEFGRKRYKVVSEEGELLESGFKYSIPYEAKAVVQVKKNTRMGCSFYHKQEAGITRACHPDKF